MTTRTDTAAHDDFRRRWHKIVFGVNTRSGKIFDVVLLVAILLSVLALALETIPGWEQRYGFWFKAVELGFTAIFTAEYLLRLYVSERPWRYARSFFGIVDLISILPTWLNLLVPGIAHFGMLRSLRLLRVFRVLKLARFANQAYILRTALAASAPKIGVFIMTLLMIDMIFATAMYWIEGPENGFTSIPVAMYWGVVTITTVGYGDIHPQTPIGQLISAILMIFGYGIIAVPTGIIGAEIAGTRKNILPRCDACGAISENENAVYCHQCGEKLPE
jgi:voltage-gated potassium channel